MRPLLEPVRTLVDRPQPGFCERPSAALDQTGQVGRRTPQEQPNPYPTNLMSGE